MRDSTVRLILSALLLVLSAKPVAKVYRGPLDTFDVKQQSALVLARFEQADRAEAEGHIAEVSKALLLTHSVRVSFIRTNAGALAALTLDAEGPHLAFGRFTALALKLSSSKRVA